MQELRSTDILDKEILADANKKAEKLLKKTDAECESLLNSLPEAIEKIKAEKQDFYSKKLESYENNQKASLPLEKQRFEVSFIQSAIQKNINKYFASLTDAKKMDIVCNKIALDGSKKVNAFVYGFNLDEAKSFLSKKLGKNLLKCSETIINKIVPEESFGLENPQGIILEEENKEFRVRLTLSAIIENVIDNNRQELADALFGGSL